MKNVLTIHLKKIIFLIEKLYCYVYICLGYEKNQAYTLFFIISNLKIVNNDLIMQHFQQHRSDSQKREFPVPDCKMCQSVLRVVAETAYQFSQTRNK